MKSNGYLPMFDIYHNGIKLGTVHLSEKLQGLLNDGETVQVVYHAPQLLRAQIGAFNGSFELHKENNQIVTDSPAQVQDYLKMQSAIEIASRGN